MFRQEERSDYEPAPGFDWKNATNNFLILPGMSEAEIKDRTEACKNELQAFVVAMYDKLVSNSPYKNWVLVTLVGGWLVSLESSGTTGPRECSVGSLDMGPSSPGVYVDASFAFVPDVCLS